MKKRLIFFTHEFPPQIGGVGLSTNRLAANLSKAYEVKVIVVQKDSRFIPDHDNLFDVSAITIGDYRSVADQQDCYVKLKHLIQAYAPDLLITMYLTNFGLITAALAKQLNIPHIASIRGSDIGKHFFDPSLMSQISYILTNSDYIISVNKELLSLANTIVDISSKSIVIHNSVHSNPLDPADKFKIKDIDNNRVVVGIMGVFKRKKGIDIFLKALLEINDDFDVLILGDFNDQDCFREVAPLLLELEKKKKVVQTGMIKYQDRFKYLNLIDFVVVPSRFSEGCPSTLLESLALGKVIICSDSGSNTEIIDDKVNGFVFESESVYSLKNKIEEALNFENLDVIRKNALKRTKSLSFDSERKKWSKIVDGVLSKSKL